MFEDLPSLHDGETACNKSMTPGGPEPLEISTAELE